MQKYRKKEREKSEGGGGGAAAQNESLYACAQIESTSTCFGVFSSYTLCSKGGAGSVDLNLSGNDISIIGVVVV